MSKRLMINPGDKFHLVTVIEEVKPIKKWKRRFLVSCVCGVTCYKTLEDLRSKPTNSCGCWRKKFALRHGCTSTSTTNIGKLHRGTPEYNTWTGIKQRCLNHKNLRYHDYGGRGITICEEWRNSFTSFLSYVGTKPSSNHSIDRINPNGNYEPGNVRWATRSEQQLNRRINTTYVQT